MSGLHIGSFLLGVLLGYFLRPFLSGFIGRGRGAA